MVSHGKSFLALHMCSEQCVYDHSYHLLFSLQFHLDFIQTCMQRLQVAYDNLQQFHPGQIENEPADIQVSFNIEVCGVHCTFFYVHTVCKDGSSGCHRMTNTISSVLLDLLNTCKHFSLMCFSC